MSDKSKIDINGYSEIGAIELPLVNVTEGDVYGALLVHNDINETFKDSILKLQTWVINFSEEQIVPLRDSGKFTEGELDEIKKKICVISPLTLAMYIHWQQMETFIKMTDSEKERTLLEKIPDRFKARYKGNISCRQARDITDEEEIRNIESPKSEEEDMNEEYRNMSFAEFVKEIGKEIKSLK